MKEKNRTTLVVCVCFMTIIVGGNREVEENYDENIIGVAQRLS